MRKYLCLWSPALSVPVNLARILYGAAGLACLFYGLLPAVCYRILHTGVAALLGGGAALCAAFLWIPALSSRFRRAFRPVHAVFFAAFAAAAAVYAAFVISYAAYCARNPPPASVQPHTVIVLGAAIDGDRPKLMLSRRLRAAARYLKENTAARCVVTGGQGPDEAYPEALVMRDYLGELGIDKNRVLMEGESRDTRENIAFAAEIIAREALSPSVTVVSDAFHQLRAAYFCRENGLEPHAITSLTPWGLLPTYQIREMGAWVKALLKL